MENVLLIVSFICRGKVNCSSLLHRKTERILDINGKITIASMGIILVFNGKPVSRFFMFKAPECMPKFLRTQHTAGLTDWILQQPFSFKKISCCLSIST